MIIFQTNPGQILENQNMELMHLLYIKATFVLQIESDIRSTHFSFPSVEGYCEDMWQNYMGRGN